MRMKYLKDGTKNWNKMTGLPFLPGSMEDDNKAMGFWVVKRLDYKTKSSCKMNAHLANSNSYTFPTTNIIMYIWSHKNE